MAVLFRHCSCFRPETEDIQVLDYWHCNLVDVPDTVFTYERTLEELNLDANKIKDLPRPLFHCHGLKILSLNDNEIESLPPAIASLINLEELDVSHNSILNFPDNIKGCKHLSSMNASVNPLGKLPDGLTQLVNLTQLYLNDTFLDFLPANFGRLSQLKILELRENHLKTLPKSMARLNNLKRLDIGHNEFNELPEVVGSLQKITELWCDSNRIMYIPDFIGNLKDLLYFDMSFNRVMSISYEIDGCYQLQDLHLSYNKIDELPESIGNLRGLTMLKLDENRIRSLPNTIGRLSSLQELVLSTNDLAGMPPSIGLLRNLSVLNVDENYLESLPPEIGSCVSLTILSVRTNRLHRIPHELGHIPRLSVLNISDNFIHNLPFSITKLRKLSAIWISENQNKPLVPFQSCVDPETGQRVLTCILLPQIPREDSEDGYSDGRPASWEDKQDRQIKFAGDGRVVDQPSSLVRLPTPYPKEMKAHAKHAKNLALKHHTNTSPSEKQNNVIESNLVCPDITASAMDSLAISVKEAKISKPKSPILSTMPKPSSPKFYIQMSDNLTSTTQSADSGMASGQHSELTIPMISSDTERAGSQTHINHGIICNPFPNPSIPSNHCLRITNSPGPAHHKLLKNRTFGDMPDRGYRSDNEFYAADNERTRTPDGYHSDWEAINTNRQHPNVVGNNLQNKNFTQTALKRPDSRSHTHESNSLRQFTPLPLNHVAKIDRGPDIHPIGYDANFDYPRDMVNKNCSPILQPKVSSNRSSPMMNIPQSMASQNSSNRNSPMMNIAQPIVSQHPRQPPDYNTALQRSSLYSKFHGPIDTILADGSVVQSSRSSPQSQVFMPESKPNSRSSHASDAGSVISSTNSMGVGRTTPSGMPPPPPVNDARSNPGTPNTSSGIPKEPAAPPPLLPKPNINFSASLLNSNSFMKQAHNEMLKELNAINSERGGGPETVPVPTDGVNTHKAIPVQVVSDTESNELIDNSNLVNTQNTKNNCTQLGFTPISPAPNVKMYNHIVRPSLPLPQVQQLPSKESVATGQWLFGAHKNPKVFPVVIEQNPDIGFTITSKSRNFPSSTGIFVETVALDGPASSALKPGDKILEVDGIDFTRLDNNKAISVLDSCKNTLCLMISRES